MSAEEYLWQGDQGQHWWQRIHKPEAKETRPLLLLHGAGVGGDITWRFCARYLQSWRDIWVIDLPGMGQAQFKHQKRRYSLDDYITFINEGLFDRGITFAECDVAAYSFGALIWYGLLEREPNWQGMAFLLEPAMLSSLDAEDLCIKARSYHELAEKVLLTDDAPEPLNEFLDLVSPNRVRDSVADQLASSRLQAHRHGFAHALLTVMDVLIERVDTFVRWQPPCAGLGLVGEYTPDVMHKRHQVMAQGNPDWEYVMVPKSDHSLIFTKPRFIARSLDHHWQTIRGG